MKMTIFFTLILSIFAFSGCQTASTQKADNAPVSSASGEIKQITVTEAKQAVDATDVQFIDVRTPEEYEAGHAYRARNIPLDKLMDNLGVIEKNEPVYLICQTGRRSLQAAKMLNGAGYTQTISIAGGTTAWQEAGLPMAGKQ